MFFAYCFFFLGEPLFVSDENKLHCKAKLVSICLCIILLSNTVKLSLSVCGCLLSEVRELWFCLKKKEQIKRAECSLTWTWRLRLFAWFVNPLTGFVLVCSLPAVCLSSAGPPCCVARRTALSSVWLAGIVSVGLTVFPHSFWQPHLSAKYQAAFLLSASIWWVLQPASLLGTLAGCCTMSDNQCDMYRPSCLDLVCCSDSKSNNIFLWPGRLCWLYLWMHNPAGLEHVFRFI